jgi:uncharacterized protein YjbJ (UPF0337 family)
MDRNSVEGKARRFGGQVQDAVGDFTDDGATQMRGKANQAAAAAQDAMGSAMDNAERWLDSVSEMAKSRPLTTVAIAVVAGYTLRALTHWRRG